MLRTRIACVFAICAGLLLSAQSPPFPGRFPAGVFTNRAALDAGAAGYQGPGDVVAGATFFYSCTRAYNAAYLAGTPKLCDLQRLSDNAVCTVSAASNGYADVAVGTPCTGATVTAFCNATTCAITQLYDQTGNAQPVTQTVAVARYFVLTLGGFGTCPAIDGNNSASAPIMLGTVGANVNQPFSTSAVLFNASAAAQQDFISFAGGSIQAGWGQTAGTAFVFAGSVPTGEPAVTTSAWQAMTGLLNAASSKIALQGSSTTLTATIGTTNIAITNAIEFGAAATGSASWTGKIEEVGLWPSDISSSIAALTTNQRSTSCGSF